MRRHVMMFASCVVAAACVNLALSQDTKPAPSSNPASQPVLKADQLLKHIPGDVMGFAIVRSPQELSAKGVGFIKGMLPKKLAQEITTDPLQSLVNESSLGETFDSRGAVAFLLMDVQKVCRPAIASTTKPALPKVGDPCPSCGQKLPDNGAGATGDDCPNCGVNLANAIMPKFEASDAPVAVMLPGSDAEKMFPGRDVTKDGKYMKVAKGTDDIWWCLPMDGFLVVSPNKKVLEQFPAAKSMADHIVDAGQKAILAQCDAVAWTNVAMLRKSTDTVAWQGDMFKNVDLSNIFENFGSLIMIGAAVAPPLYAGVYVGYTRQEIFKNGDEAIAGIEICKDGLKLVGRETFAPAGPFGKALAAWKPPTRVLTDRLPALPYMFAYGCTKDFNTPMDLKIKQITEMMGIKELEKVPAEARKQIQDAIVGIHEEVTAVQHYLGPTTDKYTGIGFVSVIECKDPKRLLKRVEDLMKGAGEFAKAMEFEPVKDLTITYTNSAEKIDDLAVDTIVIEHPDMSNMGEESRRVMKSLVGEDKIRVFLAAVDKKTVVLTIGGGKDFFKTAVAAAKEGKTAYADDEINKVSLGKLDKNNGIVFMLNMSNSFNAVVGVAQVVGAPIPALQMADQPPIVGGVAYDAAGFTFTGWVPQAMIKAFITTITAPQMMGGGLGF